ncbi:MAG TPA: isoprenylcysteine carboxylmethyltransferase family protein [Planococcus sp. (in: firmicutes)]|nr:isoprenylcysteine carboxylmethyltransferase family protein [Planococcus sp. (in: firmicutes)]
MTFIDWIFGAVSLIWIGEFVFFRNRSAGASDPLEKRSFFLIFAALAGTIVLAMLLKELQDAGFAEWMKGAGALLFTAGVFLRIWGIVHLKNQFTRYVTVREGDQIVSTGPYRRLRHPLYTGLFFIALGMALYFTSIVAAVVGGAAVAWALLKRMDYEETLLIEKFGEDYVQWMKQRARLIPYFY